MGLKISGNYIARRERGNYLLADGLKSVVYTSCKLSLCVSCLFSYFIFVLASLLMIFM